MYQVHSCRTMFVDIADTTVPNLIYVFKQILSTDVGVAERFNLDDA